MFNRLINSRRSDAYKVRLEANEMANSRPHPDHINNGEEERYINPQGLLSYIANFSKGLKHNFIGEVILDAYRAMIRGMYSTEPIHFERTDMMGTLDGRNLINPQSGLAFELEGADAQAVTMPPAPRIDSAEVSGEMAELYWMALIRDINFISYPASALVGTGADSLTREFSDFRGPKEFNLVTNRNEVTRRTLFRGFTPGDLVGPYISQFLFKPIPYGTLTIPQLNRVALAGQRFMTTFPEWLRVQNGEMDNNGAVPGTGNGFNDLLENMITPGVPLPPGHPPSLFDPIPRHIRNLRDLATYVHFDALYEAYLNACLILLGMPARVDPGNPYIDMPPMQVTQRTQDGFGTFGPPHILSLVTEVATRALKAVWFQKWGVHRRLRPEEFGGRIHVHLRGLPANPPNPAVPAGRYTGMIHPEILNSLTAGLLQPSFPPAGGYLLPQAFIEGAPTHPAYGAGHATVAGACVTVLKAWFDESEVFDPRIIPASMPGVPQNVLDQMRANRTVVVPNAAGTALTPYIPPPGEPKLTVGGELNKLAANISLGRNGGGVHWRSDYTESLKLGEEIAIRILQEQKLTYNEDHHLSLTKFDGTRITI